MLSSPLTKSQLNLFFDSFDKSKEQQYKKFLIFSFFYYTGLRPSDVCSFSRRQALALLESGQVSVFEKKTFSRKKKPLIIYSFPKLSHIVRESLSLFDDPDYLFHNYRPSNFRHYLKSKSAELGFYISCTALRKSYGTRVFELTNDIYVAAEALGHSDVKNTQFYLRDPQLRLKESLARF